ncbi:MAG: 16S rRNA (guanine(966)-N(2))-methyltransferase RsmD [Neisseria sp.]|nr:16S rRNA (guanine(966)-N(2))-methyltransferase RsmD [Neisseria sp.]
MKTKPFKNQQHSNQIRIIGGQCRGRKIHFATGEGLRPTPDSVRERLFNWLGQDLTGQSVLDLFSGSGALGLEAASRNAARVMMTDNSRQAVRNLQQNARLLQLEKVEIAFSDGLCFLERCRENFDVVFLDPPFAWQQWSELFAHLQDRLNDNALVYVEAGQLPQLPQWLQRFREGKAGMSKFELLLYKQAAE